MTARKRPRFSSLTEDMQAIFGRKSLREQEDSEEELAPEPNEDGGNEQEPEYDDDMPIGEMEDDDEDMDPAEAKEEISRLASTFLAKYAALRVGSVSESKNSKKGFRKPAKETKEQRLQRLSEGRIFNTAAAPAGKKRSASRIQNLLEEVSSIVGDIHRSRRFDQIKGFANIAIVAKKLENRFRHIGMSISEGNLYKAASVMKKLSEQASDMAIGLDSPEEPEPEDALGGELPDEPVAEEGDDAAVDELFKKFMAKLLDALQLYNDVTGKEEDGEEPEGLEPDEDEDVDIEPPPVGEDDDKEDEDEYAEGDENPFVKKDDDEEEDDGLGEALRLVRAMRRQG